MRKIALAFFSLIMLFSAQPAVAITKEELIVLFRQVDNAPEGMFETIRSATWLEFGFKQRQKGLMYRFELGRWDTNIGFLKITTTKFVGDIYITDILYDHGADGAVDASPPTIAMTEWQTRFDQAIEALRAHLITTPPR
jgi:hypothetical protein